MEFSHSHGRTMVFHKYIHYSITSQDRLWSSLFYFPFTHKGRLYAIWPYQYTNNVYRFRWSIPYDKDFESIASITVNRRCNKTLLLSNRIYPIVLAIRAPNNSDFSCTNWFEQTIVSDIRFLALPGANLTYCTMNNQLPFIIRVMFERIECVCDIHL